MFTPKRYMVNGCLSKIHQQELNSETSENYCYSSYSQTFIPFQISSLLFEEDIIFLENMKFHNGGVGKSEICSVLNKSKHFETGIMLSIFNIDELIYSTRK